KGAVNLLQGRYGIKKKLNIALAPWRYAAILAGVFFALHLGVQGWRLMHLQREDARLDSEITQVYQTAMPGAPMPDPLQARRQIESRLAILRGGAPSGGMLATMSTLAEAIRQTP